MNGTKILLAQPLWSIEEQFGKYSKGAGNNTFSYGMSLMASVLEKEGYHVDICDSQFLNFSAKDFEDYLAKGKYDIIGMPCYTASVNFVHDTSKICKRILPKATIVIGGIHPTLMPRQTLQEIQEADIVVRGEGEYTLLDIVRHHENGSPGLQDIKGIGFRENGSITLTPERPVINDLDALPLPAYHKFPMRDYKVQFTIAKRLPTFGAFASRGCPFKCAFCNANDVHGKKFRYRGVDNVIEEIMHLKEHYGARGVTFQDSTFTGKKSWVKEFCERIIKEKIDMHFMCYARVDTVNEELLKLMRKAGFWGISFGLESANPKSLKLLNKGTTVEQNVNAVKLSQKLGYYVQTSYILALPGETKDDAYNTIKFARKLGTELSFFNRPTPYPHTRLYNICKETGGLKDNIDWNDYNVLQANKSIYVNPNFKDEEIKKLLNHAMYSYYLTPKVIYNNMKHIRSMDDLKKYYSGFMGVFGKSW